MGLFRRKAKVTVHSEVIDASGLAGLGDEILETLHEHGIDPSNPQVIDASTVPGLTQEIMETLGDSGVWGAAFGDGQSEADDKVEQLEKLAELHKGGALSDYEFAVAKQKLLGERWEN